jgi:hypothetical protein
MLGQLGPTWQVGFVEGLHRKREARQGDSSQESGVRSRGRSLTLHLKQSRWKVPSKARTNCPVKGSPHFLQIRSCPLAVRPRPLDRFRSLLFLVSLWADMAGEASRGGGRAGAE